MVPRSRSSVRQGYDETAAGEIELAAALDELPRLFGYSALKPGQGDVLRAIYAGEDVLAVMPTGAGKSLCYQLPAFTRPGLTVVVSPLIALMRDQVLRLAGRGRRAAALHSNATAIEQVAVRDALRGRRLDILYVSPERFVLPDFLRLLREAGTRLVAIDEAHCIAQWGHHFRPDYLDLKPALADLGDPQVIALTASADAETREEIVRHLFAREPRVVVRSFERENLRLVMVRKTDALRQVPTFVDRQRGSAGLVYVSTRRRAELFAERLRGLGHDAWAYHAGLSAADRAAAQDAFLTQPAPVICGTVAFGLGIDRPDVRFVCHADMPASVEAYYQEIGRAGRDGDPAEALLLHSPEDAALMRDRLARADHGRDHIEVELRKFAALEALCESDACRRAGLLAALGEQAPACGVCDNCRRSGIATLFNRLQRGTRRVVADKMPALLGGSARPLPEPAQRHEPSLWPNGYAPPLPPSPVSVVAARARRGLDVQRAARARALGGPPKSVSLPIPEIDRERDGSRLDP